MTGKGSCLLKAASNHVRPSFEDGENGGSRIVFGEVFTFPPSSKDSDFSNC